MASLWKLFSIFHRQLGPKSSNQLSQSSAIQFPHPNYPNASFPGLKQQKSPRPKQTLHGIGLVLCRLQLLLFRLRRSAPRLDRISLSRPLLLILVPLCDRGEFWLAFVSPSACWRSPLVDFSVDELEALWLLGGSGGGGGGLLVVDFLVLLLFRSSVALPCWLLV